MDNRPIGVFDSGLGGLTVVKELIHLLPKESIIYFGDTGRVPYGTRGRDTVIKYAISDINFLMTKNVKAIVIACGTASSIALSSVVPKYDIPIIGVVSPTASAAAAATRNKKVGIIGTAGTISSGAYVKELKSIDPEIEPFSMPCPLFVPIVENGYTDGEVARLVATEYLEPLKKKGVDTIILGCTHYPLLKGVISDIMGGDTVLVDSGRPVAERVASLLYENGMETDGVAQYQYFVSDTVENFASLGGLFMQQEISNSVSRIDIEKY
ncbi:MAG: Glutamate racemase [Firmicutes bacterium ADurb.Bin193]|nr:MAG: Glutamate racemase [Firmicutes bacterium ADurb.Bin193]